jgi:hypothetical protein
MMSMEDVDEHVKELLELQKTFHDAQIKFDFQMHQKSNDHTEEMKKV